jgi:aerobic C4-dicarboxylate transport protein
VSLALPRILRQLWFQVLAATAAGAAVGLIAPDAAVGMQPLGDFFVNLVRMIVGPVIFCTVVHGISGMNDMKRVGRVAVKALVYFEAVTAIALLFALIAVNLWRPGAGMNVDLSTVDTSAVSRFTAAQPQGFLQFVLHIVPATFFSAFVSGDVLQVLFVSVLFAFALALVGERARPIVNLIGGASQVFFRIVGIIMYVAPVGAFGAIAFTVGRFGGSTLVSLAQLLVEFFAVSALFVAIVLGAIARSCGVSMLRLIAYIRDELMVVAATTSSETVLPRLIEKMRGAGFHESVVGLVIPTSYSFNLDGTCLYLATATVFLAQATNTPLNLSQQLALVAVMLLTSKGAAGVAGAAFVVLAATLSSAGSVPVAAVALVLGIHRPMAEALTFVNVIGDCVATAAIARWDRAVDEAALAATIGVRRAPQAGGAVAGAVPAGAAIAAEEPRPAE